jgi:hypothetical protein
MRSTLHRPIKIEVKTPNTKKIATVSIMALCLSFCAILQVYHFTLKQPGYDFYNFWIYAQEFRHSHVPNFYSNEFDRFVAQKYLQKALTEENHSKFKRAALWSSEMYEQGHVSAATPLFYATLSTVVSSDYDTDLAIFQFVSTLIFCLTIYAIGRALGNGISTVFLTISFLFLFWTPFHVDTEVANLARIQAGLLGGCILIWRHFNHRLSFILGGLLLGISVLLKPNIVGVPISLAIVWFFRGRYNKLLFVILGAISGGLISLAYSSIYFGSLTCWANWFQALVDLQQNPLPVGYNNLSFVRLVEHYFEIDISMPILLGLLSSFILCCWFAKKRRVEIHANLPEGQLIEDLLGMGAGLIMIFMSFKVVWDHYLLLLAPVLLGLISPVEIRNQISEMKINLPTQLLTGLLFFIYALFPLRLLVPTASAYDIAAIIGIASLTFWALLISCLYQELKG